MKPLLKIAVITLLMLLLNTATFAQADSVDVFINNVMQKRKIPGLQLAIVKDGKIIKTGNYGVANLQDSIPVNDNTVFNINSITKAFTGVAIMQLAETGNLKLSSPVSEFLTDLPAAWHGVTVLQLLSHTSGIPDIVDEEESVLIAPGLNASWKQVISSPMDFIPGERFQYNQTNYLLLGRIIDTLSGMPFTEFITKEQLQIAGMNKTIRSGFGATKDIVPHVAGGYRWSQGKLINMFFSFPTPLQTAAGMSSTAKEMAAWIIALQSGKLLMQDTSMKLLWQPARLNNGKTGGFSTLLNGYAVGWPIITRDEYPAAAAVGGGRSAVFVYPQDDLCIVVLTNLAGGAPDVFIDELAGLFIPGLKAANGFGLSKPAKELRSSLEKTGYKNAIAAYNQLKKKNAKYHLNENEINSWGYLLINQNRIADALEIFKLNVSMYPNSANAFDSLGETYAEMGAREMAIKNYERSLLLDPKNENGARQLERLKAKN